MAQRKVFENKLANREGDGRGTGMRIREVSVDCIQSPHSQAIEKVSNRKRGNGIRKGVKRKKMVKREKKTEWEIKKENGIKEERKRKQEEENTGQQCRGRI